MDNRDTIDEDTENMGRMWALDQKIDQPMDEEASRLKHMYREKVLSNCVSICLLARHFLLTCIHVIEWFVN